MGIKVRIENDYSVRRGQVDALEIDEYQLLWIRILLTYPTPPVVSLDSRIAMLI
jgi:hypothetical protein